MMKREDIIRSQPTKQLIFWQEQAVTSGGNRYTYFDSHTSRTLNFTKSEIVEELNTREDKPKSKKK